MECQYLNLSNNLVQCDITDPVMKLEIRNTFVDIATKNTSEKEKSLGISGGPPNCMFYLSDKVEYDDCPYFEIEKDSMD